MDTKFTIWSPAIYARMQFHLGNILSAGMKILDLGPYEGNLEDFMDKWGFDLSVIAIDIDENALAILNEKTFNSIEVCPIKMDGNYYLENYTPDPLFDLVLSSASIHELNDPNDQPRYLDWFFTQLNRILKPGGKAIIADLYFPSWITDEEVDSFRQFQWETIHHASERKEFVFPELIDEMAMRNGFRLVSKEEIRAVEEIDRRYYVLVFQKP